MNHNKSNVKSKFFNQDLYDEAKISDIGSTTTNGQVISWGVGHNRTNDVSLNQTNSFNVGTFNNNDNNSFANSNGMFDSSKFSNSLNGTNVFENSTSGLSASEMVENNFNIEVVQDRVESQEFLQNTPVFPSYDSSLNSVPPMQGGMYTPQMVQASDVLNQYNNVSYSDNTQNVSTASMMEQQVVQNNLSVQSPMMQQPMMDIQQRQSQMIQSPVQNIEQQNFVSQPQMMQSMDGYVNQQFDINNQNNSFVSTVDNVQPSVHNNNSIVGQPLNFDQSQFDMSSINASPIMMEAFNSNQQPINNVDKQYSPMNFDSSAGLIDENLRSNQPLSMMSLGGESLDEEQKPKDVVENSKYFQTNPLVDNTIKAEEIVAVPVIANDVLAEPVRDINFNALAQAFVGEKFRDISMAPFNIWAVLFSTFYYFYRKMYLYGIIYAILNICISILIIKMTLVGLAVSLTVCIIAGLITNPLYISFAKKEVIKIVYNNSKASQYELTNICSKKGGTSFIGALLISICVGLISSLILNLFGFSDYIKTLYNQNYVNVLKSDKTAKLEEVIDYKIPDGFSVSEKNSGFYDLIVPKGDDGPEDDNERLCRFDIGLVAGYKTSKDLVTYMADNDKRYNRVGTYTAQDGTVWDTYEFETRGVKTYYRSVKINDHIVLVTYLIGSDYAYDVCSGHLENIMNSVKEK